MHNYGLAFWREAIGELAGQKVQRRATQHWRAGRLRLRFGTKGIAQIEAVAGPLADDAVPSGGPAWFLMVSFDEIGADGGPAAGGRIRCSPLDIGCL